MNNQLPINQNIIETVFLFNPSFIKRWGCHRCLRNTSEVVFLTLFGMSRNFFVGSFFSRGAVIMGQMGASIRKKQTGFLYLFRYTCNYSTLQTYVFSNIMIEICFVFCLHISAVFRVCIFYCTCRNHVWNGGNVFYVRSLVSVRV